MCLLHLAEFCCFTIQFPVSEYCDPSELGHCAVCIRYFSNEDCEMQKPRPCQNSCHKSCHFCTRGTIVTRCRQGICSHKSCHFYVVQVTPLQKWDGCFPLNLPFFFRSETATVAIPYSTFVIRHFSRVLTWCWCPNGRCLRL